MADRLLQTPNVLMETANGLSQVSVTDVLFNSRDLYLTDGVDASTCAVLIQQLMYLEKDKPGENINLFINSPGGSVQDGLAVYDLIRTMESPVTTICLGRAASMGALLFLAGDTRKMYEHSEIMIHDASFGSADFSGLKPDEIKEKTEDLMETCKILRGIVSERTGRSEKEVAAKMRKDSYFNANKAIEFGLATEIIK